MADWLILFLAGILGGAVNSAAGGAKLFVFPLLLAVGLSPVSANATAAVALWPAQLSAIWVNRRSLTENPARMFAQTWPALVGAFLGALALIFSSEAAFLAVVPALLVLSVIAIVLGRRLSTVLQRAFPGGRMLRATQVLMAAVGFYGGYFGAGLGFMLIAVLSAAGGLAMREANTLKNATAFCIFSVAVVPLSLSGLVVWEAAGIVLAGGLIGGYVGGWIVRRVPDTPLRIAVAVIGCVLVAGFLLRS